VQIVVVGEQSSGKSSVLESLTGFSFPRATTLCTRYATQISCRRELDSYVKISIIPRPGANATLAAKLRDFEHTITNLTNDALRNIMHEANRCMGIKMSSDEKDIDLQAFGQDILKIEINGPDEEHFTVIDVPGIFRRTEEGITTASDMSLVRDMVESYMQNSRTIILAVMSSTVDPSTQDILSMAAVADPDGLRTMGVLTKPDLVTETATRQVIKDLVLGKRHPLRLGYCVVQNRGADDNTSTLASRLVKEDIFFREPTWAQVLASGRCGISSLKTRLSELLMTISRREFPNVKADVAKRLNQCRNELNKIGPTRNEHAAQRMFLGQLGTRFQEVTQCALNGYYDGEDVFGSDPSLKLITNITKMNEGFANDIWRRGHKRHISATWSSEGESKYDLADDDDVKNLTADVLSSYPELCDIVDWEDYDCPKPKSFAEDPITDHIEHVYQMNRGSELGTVRQTSEYTHVDADLHSSLEPS
jgi:GTPase SAR1 family protein